jgi:hypothetical protein
MSVLRDPRDALEERRPDAPPGLFFSRAGHWFHDGDRIFHAGLAGLLHRSVARGDDGGLIVTTGRDTLPFVSEDAPLVARRVEVDDAGLHLSLSNGREAVVSWLALGSDHRFRAAVDDGAFWALLSRPAGQAIEPLLEVDDDDAVWVRVGDRRHPVVPLDADWQRRAPTSPPAPAFGAASPPER